MRYFIGAMFDVQNMKLVWDDGSKSTIKNWCSDQPSIDNPDNLNPIPDQCVMAIASGCWVLSTCDKVGYRQRNYICDLGQIGSCKDELTRLQASSPTLAEDINRVKATCSTC